MIRTRLTRAFKGLPTITWSYVMFFSNTASTSCSTCLTVILVADLQFMPKKGADVLWSEFIITNVVVVVVVVIIIITYLACNA